MSRPTSLRQTYAHSAPSGWTFSDIPPHAGAGVPSSPPTAAVGQIPSTLTEPLDATGVLRGLVAAGLLQYGSTALAQPFEVGKVLLQVQWVPRGEVAEAVKPKVLELDEEEEVADEELEPEEDDYFRDPSIPPAAPRPRARDARGYLLRTSPADSATRPSWVIPVRTDGGVWGMIKAVARSSEGFTGLWKGTLTTCIYDLLSSTLQPLVLSFLTSTFLPHTPPQLSLLPLSALPNPTPHLLTHLISHTLTHLLLSPLDLARTRLIAQSTMHPHRKYSGPLDALRKIAREEGGWWSLWTHPNLLVPTLLDCTIRPGLQLATPLFLERKLRLSPDASPVAYALSELACSVTSLLITLPIETVRRRLQTQTRPSLRSASAPPYKTCVETRPMPYAGVVEAIYRIVTEETSPSRKEDEKEGRYEPGRWGGVRALYRGFGMGASASALVFVLGLVGGTDGAEGWTEI